MFTPWTQEELSALWKEVGVESDRGCVLLCAAMLDRMLERMLRLKFRHSSNATDKEIDGLLSGGGQRPLGAFRARNRTAYLLGLIDTQTFDAVQKFADIRNKFAHRDKPPALTKNSVAPVVNLLPKGYVSAIKTMANDKDMPPNQTPARRLLVMAVMGLFIKLRKSLENQNS